MLGSERRRGNGRQASCAGADVAARRGKPRRRTAGGPFGCAQDKQVPALHTARRRAVVGTGVGVRPRSSTEVGRDLNRPSGAGAFLVCAPGTARRPPVAGWPACGRQAACRAHYNRRSAADVRCRGLRNDRRVSGDAVRKRPGRRCASRALMREHVSTRSCTSSRTARCDRELSLTSRRRSWPH